MKFSREYQLFLPSGMNVTLLDAGASVSQVHVPDSRGEFGNVALALRRMDDPSCAGVTLAPYAGRIAQGKMEIDGKMVQLSINEGKNHIHGGFDAPVHKRWALEGTRETAEFQEVSFSIESADGTDGYPGNRLFTTTYRLMENNRLEILLTAQTDRPTRVNLSNHAYFNLGGDFSKSVEQHHLEIQADEMYMNDEAFLMAGRGAPPAPLDFKAMRPIGAPHGHPQLEDARGLNHCYVLCSRKDRPAAVLLDPPSGRRLRLYTDQPCVMVYSGGYLDTPNCAIALEAQEHPLCPYAPPAPVLRPGEICRRRIVYQFDTV